MRILVLGGTAWLSSLAAAEAVARGHDVTAFARGSVAEPPAGVEFVRGDRESPADLAALPGSWDAAIDVARQPGHVRAAVAALGGRVAHWVYVSSASVYADHSTLGGREDELPVLPPLEADVMADLSEYGAAKSACETILRGAVGEERCHIARAGLIGGPGDRSGRSVYWPWRFAHPADPGGRVLVPDVDHPTQVVDVRDLATWLVDAAERRIAGTANLSGGTVTLREHLEVAREAGGAGRPVPAEEDWLEAHDVRPWAGARSLPLWLPAELAGMGALDTSRAESWGFRRRPLAETLADARAWREAHPDVELGAGLTDDEERELLAALG